MVIIRLLTKTKGVVMSLYQMNDAVAKHIVAIAYEVFKPDFNQSGQMSKFVQELDKEFNINYKE